MPQNLTFTFKHSIMPSAFNASEIYKDLHYIWAEVSSTIKELKSTILTIYQHE